MRNFFLGSLFAICLIPFAATAHFSEETAVDDFVDAMQIAGSLHSSPSAGIEAMRTAENGSRTGLSVTVLEPRGNIFAGINFQCPYTTPTSFVVETCNGQAQGNPPGEPMASFLAALGELAEAATEADLNPAYINFVKAWNHGGRTYLRVSYTAPPSTNGNVVFSCHVAGHGSEVPHMHCHFQSVNPVGPNEPFANVR